MGEETKSYSGNYLKIYFWQSAAYILQLSSLFLVTPFLSSKPDLYGIYVVCIAISTYLNYGDFGFLSATQKYASEAYINKDIKKESEFLGFGFFILTIVSIIFIVLLYLLSIHPDLLINNLKSIDQFKIASGLLFILCLSTPVYIFKRLINIIYDIRLASHQFQRLFLFNSLISVFSVFYFFKNENYNIVNYFLFTQILNLITVIVSVIQLKKVYNFNITNVIKNIRYNKIIFLKSNKLAFSGLLGMLSWFVFFEIDQIVISKMLGSEKVAIYAVAFTFTILFRGIIGIIFGPFMVRANYFVGQNKIEELKIFCTNLVKYTAALTVIPTIVLSLSSKYIILCWVGNSYEESVNIARVTSLLFTLSFFTSSINIFIVVTEKIKESNIISILTPIIFWLGVLFLFPYLFLFSFAISKLTIIILIAFFYGYMAVKHLNMSLRRTFFNVFKMLFFPVLFIFISFYVGDLFLPVEKSKTNLLYVILYSVITIMFSYIIMILSSVELKKMILNILKNIKSNPVQ